MLAVVAVFTIMLYCSCYSNIIKTSQLHLPMKKWHS